MGAPPADRPRLSPAGRRRRGVAAGLVACLTVSAAVGLGACTPSPSPSEPSTAVQRSDGTLPRGDRARVDRVVDGDTLIVDGRRVRIIGIDAPESVAPDRPVECFGPEASRILSELLPPRTPVLLEYDVERLDQYDRVLAHVWTPDPPRLVSRELVEVGAAEVRTYPPNVRHVEELSGAQDRARADDLGLWAC